MAFPSFNRCLLLFNMIIACWNIVNIHIKFTRNLSQEMDDSSRNKPSRREEKNCITIYNEGQHGSLDLSEAELKVQFVQMCKENRTKTVFENKQCKMVSSLPIEHTMARFIIFQRNEGYRILDLISHYKNVVPFDSIVVIDHQGTDPLTA